MCVSFVLVDKMKQLLLLTASLILLASAQDCPLPNNTQLETAMRDLPVDGEGVLALNPTIIGSIQYVCLAQGNMIDTYRTLSVIATYTPRPGESSRTNIFQLICSSGVWTADTTGTPMAPDPSVVNVTRYDCSQCRHSYGVTRCRACDSTCNTGLMRCTSPFSDGCCSFFDRNGQCTNDNCTVSSGPNFIATASNNFTCTCNLTCPAGHIVNTTSCNECIFTSICDRDSPCHNGGNCIQHSPATNYTCDCTGFYTGYNCSVCSLTCSSGYVPNSSCTKCDFVSICERDDPCQNGGNCIQYSPATNYTCHCTGLYTGYNCSVCSLLCSPGYIHNNNCTGCDLTDICTADNPCKNGGSCETTSNGYTCNCIGNYNGDNCTNCLLACENFGNVTANCTGCTCPVGYTGDRCETMIDPCDGNPCGVYGSCVSNSTKYMCRCEEGWSGQHCRECSIKYCDRCSGIPPICQQCNDGYVIAMTGKECQLQDLCYTKPCSNNGTCVGVPGSFTCQCTGRWSSSSNCTKCSDGYGLRNNQCVSCLRNCLVCTENANECSRCEDEYKVSSAGECISSEIPNNILIWIIIGSVIGGLIILVLVCLIVMAFVRCTGCYNERAAHKKAEKKASSATNKTSDNPLYISHEDIDKAGLIEED